MSVPESQRFAAALVELTDSTIGLMEATSQRSVNYKHLIESLRASLMQRNQTVTKQSQIIEALSRKYAELEYLLGVAEERLREYGEAGETVVKHECVDEIKLPSLECLRRWDVIPDSGHPFQSPSHSASQLKLAPLDETSSDTLKRSVDVHDRSNENRHKILRGV